jgi:mono/diheme cytochrome c family protein
MIRPLVTVIILALVLTACASPETGTALKEGRSVYGNICSACHGSAGQGAVGPSLEAVAETFPTCDDQIEWITLGSDQWAKTYGEKYGALGAAVKGGMPSHANTLTPAEIAAVAAFERSTYGGLDEQTAIEQCGIETSDE